MRNYLALLPAGYLLLLPLGMARGEGLAPAPTPPQWGRTVIAINDKATLGGRGGGLWSVATIPTPVVFERTLQALPTGFVTIIRRDIRGDVELSGDLAEAAADYPFSRNLARYVQLALAGAPLQVQESDTVQGILKRTKILHPVSLSEPDAMNKNKNFPEWEGALLQELKQRDLADHLLEINVHLWGIWMGGLKVEQQDDDKKVERFMEGGGNLAALASRKGAQALLGIKTQVIRISDGAVVWQEDISYVTARKTDTSTAELMADGAALFQEKMDCLIQWYARDLSNKLKGEPPAGAFECPALKAF